MEIISEKEINILIADDDIVICNMLEILFKNKPNINTDIVQDGLEALRQLKRKTYQIVISDIDMPGMTGTDLLKEIKNYNGMIQVIIITSHPTLSNILDAIRRGAFDIFFKPIDIKSLLASIDEIIIKLNKWNRLLKRAISNKF
jgi:DNA-binding NtrC family response regulator